MAVRLTEGYEEWTFSPGRVDAEEVLKRAVKVASESGYATQPLIIAAIVQGQYRLEAADRIAHGLERIENALASVTEAMTEQTNTIGDGIKLPELNNVADSLLSIAEAVQDLKKE